jgi:hypothetical protein
MMLWNEPFDFDNFCKVTHERCAQFYICPGSKTACRKTCTHGNWHEKGEDCRCGGCNDMPVGSCKNKHGESA